MADEMTYEIQTFTQGHWKIQAFFDDRDLAIMEARRMSESRRHVGVRVVEETWNEAAQAFQSRIVFRESEVIRHNEAVANQRADTRRSVEEERRRRQNEQKRQQHARRERRAAWRDSYAVIALKGVGIAALGFAAIYALQRIGG